MKPQFDPTGAGGGGGGGHTPIQVPELEGEALCIMLGDAPPSIVRWCC